MPSKATAGVALAAGAYAATAFLAPSQVTQQPTPATLQGQRQVRQPQTTTTSLATGAVALGMAGVAVANTQARASRARAQVVRQATSVAEKVFTKMPASVKPGVVTGHFLANHICAEKGPLVVFVKGWNPALCCRDCSILEISI